MCQIKPLQWEKLSPFLLHAPAPLFGKIHVESYGHEYWKVFWQVPDFGEPLLPDVFQTASLAMAAAEKEYQRRMNACLEPAP